MKNPLCDIYEQMLLTEAEKHALQNPSSDEVGSIKTKQDLFGTKPKPVEGPEKAKVASGPSYKETSGTTSSPKSSGAKMPNSAPAKEAKKEDEEEVKGTKVTPKMKSDEETEDKKEKKEKTHKESLTMSAFETLFKKTITEEFDSQPMTEETDELELNDESGEESEAEEETEEEMDDEGDLVSDLRDLQDRLSSILSKLEDATEDTEDSSEEEYTEDDFEAEFGEESENDEDVSMKESLDKPKPLNSAKGKGLMNKKNKVGRLSPKKGKANTGTLKCDPKPKALGDKKAVLQKNKAEVKSSIKKGDFIQ
jgi:hypothetical protein